MLSSFTDVLPVCRSKIKYFSKLVSSKLNVWRNWTPTHHKYVLHWEVISLCIKTCPVVRLCCLSFCGENSNQVQCHIQWTRPHCCLFPGYCARNQAESVGIEAKLVYLTLQSQKKKEKRKTFVLYRVFYWEYYSTPPAPFSFNYMFLVYVLRDNLPSLFCSFNTFLEIVRMCHLVVCRV